MLIFNGIILKYEKCVKSLQFNKKYDRIGTYLVMYYISIFDKSVLRHFI